MVYKYKFGKAGSYNLFYLRGLFGSVISSEVCVEIFEGYFYALSNQTTHGDKEIDWTSFYACFRFPLTLPCNTQLQKTKAGSMWRKQYSK